MCDVLLLQVRGSDDLADYLYDYGEGGDGANTRALALFGRLDAILMDGDVKVLPWMACARPVSCTPRRRSQQQEQHGRQMPCHYS